jgi:hypothetical protein
MSKNLGNRDEKIMKKAESKTKQRIRRRHKHCPVCEEEMAMSVLREAESDGDFYWLRCPECEGKFALTYDQYRKGKHPDISAVKPDKAREYHTDETYEVGQLIHHGKLDDVGLVIRKGAAPSTVDCSGSIVVSFIEIGQKTLIEGYVAA